MATVNLTEDNIQFRECWYTPKILLECLFHNFNNLMAFNKNKFGELRLYQTRMISNEPLIDFELTAKRNNLNKKDEFEMRKKVGDIYCFGARKFGKTKAVQELDLIARMLATDEGANKIGFSSVDLIHLKQVLDPVKNAFGNHPILNHFRRSLKGSPDYHFLLRNGAELNSVNFNLNSTDPGRQWYGKHVPVIYIEEASMETDQVYDKRKDAVSELGAIYRISGMTDFTPHSPSGKAFYKLQNQKWVLNYPQYINPYFDEKERQTRIEEYGGEDSINYKVFVKGEIVEDAVSAIDMKRVRDNCYLFDSKGNFTKDIKRFEISKDTFHFWKKFIVVQRPENAERIFINADIGKKVTELVVHSEVENKFEYLYNIVLYNLTQQEVEEIFRFIIKRLRANVIGIDCGDGEGRGIYSNFEREFPKENLVYYDGSMKIEVGFEYEDDPEAEQQNRVKMDKGKPIYRYEYMSEFSVSRIKELLYKGRCRIPQDFKFDTQFSSIMERLSGNRTIYQCVSSQGDHLFDAWKVFAIAIWLKKDSNLTQEINGNDDWCGSVTN